MFTLGYAENGHIVTIIDTRTQKGVALQMIGNDMAAFLRELVETANKSLSLEPGREETAQVETIHFIPKEKST